MIHGQKNIKRKRNGGKEEKSKEKEEKIKR
jgi:hypothetical protein